MEYILIGIAGMILWMIYEIWRAPMIDERTGKTLRKTKTLKNLFKKK